MSNSLCSQSLLLFCIYSKFVTKHETTISMCAQCLHWFVYVTHTCIKHDLFYHGLLDLERDCCTASQFKNIHAYRFCLKMEMYSKLSQNTCELSPGIHTCMCTHTHIHRKRGGRGFSFITQEGNHFSAMFQSQFCLRNCNKNIYQMTIFFYLRAQFYKFTWFFCTPSSITMQLFPKRGYCFYESLT